MKINLSKMRIGILLAFVDVLDRCLIFVEAGIVVVFTDSFKLLYGGVC